jgi:DNA modification methylase
VADLAVVYRPLAELTPYARNSRTHDERQVAQIQASITEFGFTNPILIDEAGGIIAGHGRVLAATKLRMDRVPCITLAGLTESQKRAYVIADNKLALNAGWDAELLAAELQGLSDENFNLDLLGFSRDEMAMLLGSSVEQADVLSLLGGARPHLMVTDPPYGVDYDPAWRRRAGFRPKRLGRVENDHMADWSPAWELAPCEVAYVWHSALHAAVVEQSLRACRFQVRAQIVWVKPSIVLSRGHYHWQHEPCWVAERTGPEEEIVTHEPALFAVKDGATAHWNGGRKQSTVWNISAKGQDADTDHSTQKPVECMRRPMENNSQAGDSVYDPFLGSGTTVIAAEMMGRRCYGMELSQVYVDQAVARWQNFSGQEAVLEGTGVSFAERLAA